MYHDRADVIQAYEDILYSLEVSYMKLSKYVCGAVRQFSLWFAKGSLGYPLLNGIDYTVDPPFEDWEIDLHPVSKESYSR